MRIHRLQLVGIGPFRDRQDLDFDALAAGGLFLVDGPTGSGKSTLIDAVVYALFGGVSGANSDVSRIRSDHSAPEEPSEVILDFSVHGRRHAIARKPAYSRPKRRGEGTIVEKATQVLVEFAADGTEIVQLTAADEIGRHVRDLLGMSAEQFRQLVVLPQGEFDALLRMKPSERLDALAALLGNAFYERVQADLLARASQMRAECESADHVVATVVAKVHGALISSGQDAHDELAVLSDPSATSSQRWGAVSAVSLAAREQAERSAEEAASAGAAFDAIQTELESAGRALASLEKTQATARVVAAALVDLEVSDAGRVEASAASVHARSGELRHWIGVLSEHSAWEGAQSQRAGARQLLALDVERTLEEAENLRQEHALLPGELSALDRQIADLEAQCARLPGLLADRERLEAALGLVSQRDEASSAWVRAAERAVAAGEVVEGAQSAVDRHRRQYDELREQQVAQAAVLLSAALEPGQPCPVCGSAEHPRPTVGEADEQVVTVQAVGQARADLTTAEARLAEAIESASKARADELAYRSERDRLEGAVGGMDTGGLPDEVLRVDEELQAIDRAEARLAEATSMRAAMAERADRFAQSLDIADADHAQALQRLASHDEAEQARQAAIGQALADACRALDDEEGIVAESATALIASLGQRAGALDRYAQAISEHVVAMSAQSLPAEAELDASQLAENMRALEARSQALAQQRLEGLGAAGRLTGLVAALSALGQEFETALERGEQAKAAAAPVVAMADIASAARGSANTRRMNLESYAIQQRFISVLEAASVHLARMSAGKFELSLEDQAKGNQQAGLGIAIFDAWTGSRRDPRTLSGGETFYVSLALALGLADVVRDEAGGVPIDTLFVDEGFGSLDQETLNQVLDQLDHLRTGGRIVGVVSHVTEMKEWVSDRIEVVIGQDRTSTARVVRDGSLD